jgi:hypothetical protein
VLTAEHLLHLERGHTLLAEIELATCLGKRLRIAFEGELEKDTRIIELGTLTFPAVERSTQLGALALDLLRARVVVPEIGLLDLLVERR